MTSTDSSPRVRPDGVTLISVWFIIRAIIPFLGAAAIVIFALPAVITNTYGSDRYFAVGGVSFGFFLVACLVVLNVAAAVGLLRLREWGRWLAIGLAALGLIMIPIGTIAGGLILWYLLSDRAKPAFGMALAPAEPDAAIEATVGDSS